MSAANVFKLFQPVVRGADQFHLPGAVNGTHQVPMGPPSALRASSVVRSNSLRSNSPTRAMGQRGQKPLPPPPHLPPVPEAEHPYQGGQSVHDGGPNNPPQPPAAYGGQPQPYVPHHSQVILDGTHKRLIKNNPVWNNIRQIKSSH